MHADSNVCHLREQLALLSVWLLCARWICAETRQSGKRQRSRPNLMPGDRSHQHESIFHSCSVTCPRLICLGPVKAKFVSGNINNMLFFTFQSLSINSFTGLVFHLFSIFYLLLSPSNKHQNKDRVRRNVPHETVTLIKTRIWDVKEIFCNIKIYFN